MRTAFLIASLALATPVFGRGQVWVVAPLECSGVDFQTIQDAVDAASDGDTILVRPRESGRYGEVEIVQKSLTVAVAESNLIENSSFELSHVTVRDLLPNQSVVIMGATLDQGANLVLEDCQGPVWVSDVRHKFFLPTTSPIRAEAISIEGCASVTFVRCVFRGHDYVENCPAVGPCLGVEPAACMRLVDSAVHLFDSFVYGAVGGPGYDPFDPGIPAGNGAVAIRVEDSELDLFRTTAGGGAGGVGGQAFPAPFCSDGGDGGTGIEVTDTTSVVRLIDATVLGGAAGPWTTGSLIPNGCVDGVPGTPITGPGAGSELVLPGAQREARFLDAYALTEGVPTTLQLRAPGGELAFLGVAVDHYSTFEPLLAGVLSLQPLKVFSLGAVAANTFKLLPIVIGDVTSPGNAVTIFVQPYFLDGSATLHVGTPAATSVLDATHELYDGCDGPVYVDDDAPGDPGPGDPNVSDPLEDGSRLHPFDSIQEAIDSVAVVETHVIVADGTYTTSGTSLGLDVDERAILIESENGPQSTIVDLQGLGAFVRLREPFLTLDHGVRGFTFRNALGFAIRCNSVDVTIEDCVFENGFGTLGAGLRMSLNAMVVRNCVFRNIVAGSQGGAIYVDSSTPLIENCTIQGNSAPVGGGLYVSDEGSRIRGCTIVGNSGGGIYYDTPASATLPHLLENCIVWGNTGANQIELTDGVLDLPYGDVQGGLGGITILGSGFVNAGPGLIALDPLFVDELAGDYHLDPASPCVDAGDPSFVPAPGDTDIDGQPRLMGAAVDLGSDEL